MEDVASLAGPSTKPRWGDACAACFLFDRQSDALSEWNCLFEPVSPAIREVNNVRTYQRQEDHNGDLLSRRLIKSELGQRVSRSG
ncbi:hypothetical protein EVAR_33296_1 [Eumeta japonica]|uniref:Uncharacterized protein n=1 Tax=Eumeta variegata TaxID=151549 RepID=A0A4C1WEY9_EUMVA|nr:hypothetical protein EVAR_33296_1 [Eumeta japonica]